MDLRTDKVMVVETDATLRDRVAAIARAAGYQVSAMPLASLKGVLEFSPDVVVMGANPPQLDCCDLLADVRGSEQARFTRVIMLATGGSAERVRGLELGADDVLSLPFEDRELLARVRAQIREKRSEDELRGALRNQKWSRRRAGRALRAMNQGRRALRTGIVTLVAVSLLATGIITALYWRSQKQSVSVYAALAKLQTGVSGERELMDLARRAKTQEQPALSSTEVERQNLKQRNQELKEKMATAKVPEVAELQKQLSASNERLQKLETESKIAEDVIRSYSSSVCLLHVTVAFRDKVSGLTLRYTTLSPPTSQAEAGDVPVQIGGLGAEVRMDAFGTGFLVSSDGRIVTNHHVVEPWWKNDNIGELLQKAPNLEPIVAGMNAYFPGVARGVPVTLQKISSDADIAVVRGNVSGLKLKLLAIDDDPKAATSGEPIVLLGYPTGIDAILARSSEDALRSIAAKTNDLPTLMTELARRELIRPVTTQGHIGDVLADKIIYDAQTTSGGSGGPLFNSAGKVIAVNVAVLRDFGGSNFAIPVRYAKRLLVQ